MEDLDHELKELVASCLEGSESARVRFQDLFGEFIYNFPIKLFRLAPENTADFYIYVFEKDKIFKRVRGYEGRNQAQFKTYMCIALRDLFIEWRRNQKEPEMVSFETTVGPKDSGKDGKTLGDFLADPKETGETLLVERGEAYSIKATLGSLDVEKRLILKLHYLAELELDPDEIRHLCQRSGRSYREAIGIVEETKARLQRKDEQLASLHDQLESIHGWILLYQKEIDKITEDLNFGLPMPSKHDELMRQKEDWERKLEWRYRQRGRALEKAKQFRMTTPYKDMAAILNVPLGTVCSLVARVRAEILRTFGSFEEPKGAAVS